MTASAPRRRLLLRLAGSLALGVLATELALQTLLFHDVPGLRRLSRQLRDPAAYFDPADPDRWILGAHLRGVRRSHPDHGLHPLLGWVDGDIDGETFAHAHEELLLERRPVLLYGDSFARCVTPAAACWEGLLQRSDLRRSHLLLNYGVSGYGLDQTWLLLRESLDRWLERDPVVVVGIFVDDDLDRAVLPIRGQPKPRLALVDGELREGDPLPPGPAQFLEAHPRPGGPYVWHFLSRRLGLGAARAAERHRGEVANLTRAILTSLRDHLAARGVDWFVALFHGHLALDEATRSDVWEDELLTRTLRELGIPFVSSRSAFARHGADTGTHPRDYFLWEGGDRGHYSPLGNRAVFPMLLGGMRGEFD